MEDRYEMKEITTLNNNRITTLQDQSWLKKKKMDAQFYKTAKAFERVAIELGAEYIDEITEEVEHHILNDVIVSEKGSFSILEYNGRRYRVGLIGIYRRIIFGPDDRDSVQQGNISYYEDMSDDEIRQIIMEILQIDT